MALERCFLVYKKKKQMSSVNERTEPKFWLIRVNDGENLRNSVYPFWGVKNKFKGFVKKMKAGDVLLFITSKQGTESGKVIAMGEYTEFYDRDDEPLLKIKTKTNVEQNWKGSEDWSIQIHYKNLYITEKQNIKVCIQCSLVILDYDTFKSKIEDDLPCHYKNFKYYTEPKEFLKST